MSNHLHSSPVPSVAELRDARKIAADQKFADHDFGDSTVTDSDSWTEDGVYWSRWIYGDGEDGERFRASFGVEFQKDTAEVADTWVEPD
ncbi:hypothetical protein OH491_24965 [Termitidicoccus mucosus]|uniref:Uncharacterized protein n=1 Tax=Termitidicoccus mucosus TaxID=1184151 RepID=A0A178IQI9_9BACT|nr:hypothetical protein AW736_01575 [Opitutaceae bacterium TSB47]